MPSPRLLFPGLRAGWHFQTDIFHLATASDSSTGTIYAMQCLISARQGGCKKTKNTHTPHTHKKKKKKKKGRRNKKEIKVVIHPNLTSVLASLDLWAKGHYAKSDRTHKKRKKYDGRIQIGTAGCGGGGGGYKLKLKRETSE